MTDSEIDIFEKPEIECSDVVKLMGDYFDGDLPPSLRGRIAAHVKGCEYCQKFESSYRFTVQLAGELKDPPMPLGVQNRLREALNKRLGLELPLVEE